MKKLIFVLMLVVVKLGAAPCQFMGVGYDKPFSQFKRVMGKRFKLVTSMKEGIIYKGKFAGYDDVTIVISGYSGKFASAMIFIKVESYNYASIYNSLCKNLAKKYGAPTEVIQDFTSPYTANDGYEWQAIRLSKADFANKWRSKESFLSVNIARNSKVNIYYINSPVYMAKRKAKEKQNNSDF